jgi:transposase-like protein
MCGPQVRFRERLGGVIPRAYSTVPPATAAVAAADAPAAGNGKLIPDPAVLEKPTRRRFTAEYKLRILHEADHCTESGQLGALLRREGLYSSLLSTWRQQRDEGTLALPSEVWINPPADGPEPRMLQLPRDTHFVPQLSQTH